MVSARFQASQRESPMPRVLELHKAIMEVTTPDQAKALVRTWGSPMQADQLKDSKETTKFCALIAEFVVAFLTRRRDERTELGGLLGVLQLLRLHGAHPSPHQGL